MIVRMSHVEAAGPIGLLDDVVGAFGELGLFQVERETLGPDVLGAGFPHKSLCMDDPSRAAERAFLVELKARIEGLFSKAPNMELRESYLDPTAILDAVTGMLPRHTAYLDDLGQRRAQVEGKLREREAVMPFLDAFAVMGAGIEGPNVHCTGVVLKSEALVAEIGRVLRAALGERFEIFSERAGDGGIAALIVTDASMEGLLEQALGEGNIPELKLPGAQAAMVSFNERVAGLRAEHAALSASLAALVDEARTFIQRWGPLYEGVRVWVQERLQLMGAATCAFRTEMCFIIRGWIPQEQASEARAMLDGRFKGSVVLTEIGIYDEDLDRVPIALKNSAYFRPYEIFTRLLPLPVYTSYDPTPFIGTFFPLLFGMILGDAGYGFVILFIALWGMRHWRRGVVNDAMRILLACSLSAIVFGVLFGEVFGSAGRDALGMHAILLDREESVVPLLVFAGAVGAAHVSIGFVFGIGSAMRRHETRQMIVKLASLALIVAFCVGLAGAAGVLPAGVARPSLIAALVMLPLIAFAGGVLAPLEVIRSLGNIISYARIGAIGLTSVYLAVVANHIGGHAGNALVGVVAAVVLHAMNLVLGVFSPTIHSLRLHYVEFFSKFFEPGGRRFVPLHKRR